jgi:hypothetical protein
LSGGLGVFSISPVIGTAGAALSDYFGEDTPFSVGSDVMTGVVRSFSNFSAALDEIKDARIFAGIHFRSACDDAQATGIAVAQYVLANALKRVHGHDDDGGDDD